MVALVERLRQVVLQKYSFLKKKKVDTGCTAKAQFPKNKRKVETGWTAKVQFIS